MAQLRYTYVSAKLEIPVKPLLREIEYGTKK